MVTVNTILKRLTELQAEHARADLTNPQGRREFDFGKACGKHEAFDLALQSIRDALEEEKQAEKEKK